MNRRNALGLLVLAIAWSTTVSAHDRAIGRPGDPAKATRTVEIDMSDGMTFTPDKVDVKKGETVHFVVRNTGRVAHEFVLGTAAELRTHAAAMAKNPHMTHKDPAHHAVEPGKTADFTWRFTSKGKVEFACLIPGHFEAGMRGKVVVK